MDNRVKILPPPKVLEGLPPKPEAKELPKGPEVPELQAGVRELVPKVLKGAEKVPAGDYFVGDTLLVPSFDKEVYHRGTVTGFDEESYFYAIRMAEGPQKGQIKYVASANIRKMNAPTALAA